MQIDKHRQVRPYPLTVSHSRSLLSTISHCLSKRNQQLPNQQLAIPCIDRFLLWSDAYHVGRTIKLLCRADAHPVPAYKSDLRPRNVIHPLIGECYSAVSIVGKTSVREKADEA